MNQVNQVNEVKTVSLQQAIALIVNNPKVRFMLRGEPGVGKTSIAEEIARITRLALSMLDVPNLDLGDVCMPVIDHESKVTRYYPNARFGIHTGEPVVMCFDEFTKGAEPVKNMLHPALEVFKPRLGDVSIPEGSFIYLTGNLDTDGVGDGLAQHTRQRVVELIVRKPNATEWLKWAAANGIHPVVMAWVDRYPQALASYVDGTKNEFIFHPSNPQDNVVSPRTLEISSNIIWNIDKYDEDTLDAALTGTATEVPSDPGARAVMTFGLLEHVEKDTLTPILQYLRRMEEEWQVVFCVALARHANKDIAFNNREFSLWAADNEDLL
jgi:MoxR-like ATPase